MVADNALWFLPSGEPSIVDTTTAATAAVTATAAAATRAIRACSAGGPWDPWDPWSRWDPWGWGPWEWRVWQGFWGPWRRRASRALTARVGPVIRRAVWGPGPGQQFAAVEGLRRALRGEFGGARGRGFGGGVGGGVGGEVGGRALGAARDALGGHVVGRAAVTVTAGAAEGRTTRRTSCPRPVRPTASCRSAWPAPRSSRPVRRACGGTTGGPGRIPDRPSRRGARADRAGGGRDVCRAGPPSGPGPSTARSAAGIGVRGRTASERGRGSPWCGRRTTRRASSEGVTASRAEWRPLSGAESRRHLFSSFHAVGISPMARAALMASPSRKG